MANLLESRQVNLGSVEMMDPGYIVAIPSLRDTSGRSCVSSWRDHYESGDNIGKHFFPNSDN